jgi:hypothetical protein
MKVRVGIAETDKVVELDVDDIDVFKEEMERAVTDGGLAWFTDIKMRTVGIPSRSVAFVEIDAEEGGPAVGFAPAV